MGGGSGDTGYYAGIKRSDGTFENMITSTRYPEVESSDTTWLKCSIESSGTTARKISYDASANNSTSERTAYIYLKYNSTNYGNIPVTQAGKPAEENNNASLKIYVDINNNISENYPAAASCTINIFFKFHIAVGTTHNNVTLDFSDYSFGSSSYSDYTDTTNYETGISSAFGVSGSYYCSGPYNSDSDPIKISIKYASNSDIVPNLLIDSKNPIKTNETYTFGEENLGYLYELLNTPGDHEVYIIVELNSNGY